MISGYMTRALKSRDPRYARVLRKMGYAEPTTAAAGPAPSLEDEMRALREEYEAVMGKRPYWGWDADELRERMAEAKEASDEG